MSIAGLCNSCHDHFLELRRCGNCHAALYCSRKCQRRHWRMQHRQECAALAVQTARAVASGVSAHITTPWLPNLGDEYVLDRVMALYASQEYPSMQSVEMHCRLVDMANSSGGGLMNQMLQAITGVNTHVWPLTMWTNVVDLPVAACFVSYNAAMRHLYINDVCVAKPMRRRGIARRLIDYVERDAVRAGVPCAVIGVHPGTEADGYDEHAVEAVWRALGFIDHAHPTDSSHYMVRRLRPVTRMCSWCLSKGRPMHAYTKCGVPYYCSDECSTHHRAMHELQCRELV